MLRLRRRRVLGGTAGAVAAGLAVVLLAPVAHATPRIPDGMPTQSSADLAYADPDNNSGQAGWADLAGGVAARPYVTSLTVVNGVTSTPVIVGGTTTPPVTSAGSVSTVVSPSNLCRHGQSPSPGVCYATPNRVGLTIGYDAGNGTLGGDFANPSVAVSPTVDSATVFDLTIALNTLGRSLRWTWVNGDLLYWRTTNLGANNATVRIRFRPATAPYVAHFPDGNGCSATPIRDCALTGNADGETLGASLVLSLDNTLDPALTGAVFATRNAISGYLAPALGAAGPTLDIQAASTHTRADSSPQLGTVQALLPAAALLNLYGVLPADATSLFTTIRTGDAGTNNPPTYRAWTEASNGSEGLLVTVSGITFSVPKYKVKGKLAAVATSARTVRGITTVSATVPACTKSTPCAATVYRLSAAKYSTARSGVLWNTRVAAKGVALRIPATKLRKNDRYLLVLRAVRTGRLVASTLGTVR
jgi:hypothetical protein